MVRTTPRYDPGELFRAQIVQAVAAWVAGEEEQT